MSDVAGAATAGLCYGWEGMTRVGLRWLTRLMVVPGYLQMAYVAFAVVSGRPNRGHLMPSEDSRFSVGPETFFAFKGPMGRRVCNDRRRDG